MKKYFIISVLMLLPLSLLSQEYLGTKDVSDWAYFSVFPYRPHLKKIDDDKFLAYYRTNPNESGFMVFDGALNVINNINLELTDNKRIISTSKAYADLMNFPYFYYRKDDNSAVLLIIVEGTDNDFAYCALTYSLEAESLIQVDTLMQSESDKGFIQFSDNEKYFVMGEHVGKDKGSELNYDVFGLDCKKLYSVSWEMPNKAVGNYVLSEDGELILSTKVEENRKIDFNFSKFDKGGNLVGSTTFSPPKTDIFDYGIKDCLIGASNEVYCVLAKERNGSMEGFAILKLDFEKGTCKKISDKTFDKAELARVYSNADISHSMIKSKKVKPIKSLDDFFIEGSYIDENGLYLVLESFRAVKTLTKNQTRYTYSGEDIIAVGLDLNGKEKWITPIKRLAWYRMSGMDFYTPSGSGVFVKSFEGDSSINLIVPSLKNVYATKIDKLTGQAIVPVQLMPENTITNTNCSLWLNENEVVVTSMEGVYFILSKNVIKLNSIRIDD